MVKKLLLVDHYGSCVGCPCRRYSEETDVARCYVKNEVIAEGVKKPKWCPLKDMPPRMSSETVSEEYAQGWNAILDAIELG